MPTADSRLDGDLAAYTDDVRRALGAELIGLVLYGSAAGDDWVAGRSDVNTAVVVRRVTVATLDALVPIVARWRPRGFALPLVVDPAQLDRSCDVFPMEIDDIRRQHRVLAGSDPFATLETEWAALRHECEQEARGKLLRLRALYLEHAAAPAELARLLLESSKSFVILLRHILRLRGDAVPHAYAAVVDAGEKAFGPLPVVRRLVAERTRPGSGDPLHELFATYLTDVERIVAAVDSLGA
jgi:hypothetical protein